MQNFMQLIATMLHQILQTVDIVILDIVFHFVQNAESTIVH